MAGIAREYPDDYEERIEDVFDRADDRAYTRAQIAAADAAEREKTLEQLAAEDDERWRAESARAETEAGSEDEEPADE